MFVSQEQCTSAARCALKINYAVQQIVNPAMKRQYPQAQVTVKHVVGIDTSTIRAARTGVRGGNDLVWVGRAANWAAKLSDLDVDNMRTSITKEVYDDLLNAAKYGGTEKKDMWTSYTWGKNGNHGIYGSNWHWSV